MELTGVTAAWKPEFLRLEYAASAPYNEFVYVNQAEAECLRGALFDAGIGEFSEAYSRVLTVAGRVEGMISCLTSEELRKCRMRSAYFFAKSKAYDNDPLLPARLAIAARALMKLQKDDYYLSRIAAVPGKGHGTRLFAHFEEEARKAGAKRLCLEVASDNLRAIAFYQKHGLEMIARRAVEDQPTRRHLDYTHMAKHLKTM